jgi:hypothetical protein
MAEIGAAFEPRGRVHSSGRKGMTPLSAVLKQGAVSAVAVALLLLASCSQSTKPTVSDESKAAKESGGPPQLVTAKTAFWPMYTSARKWTPDLVTLGLLPKEVPGFTNEAGKAAMWEAAFASPSLHQYRRYTYAITAVPPDIYKGVVAGIRLPWGGATRDVMPVDTTLFNIDSDAAYQAAAEDAAAWLKKNPDKKLSSFQLGNTYRFQAPIWYLMWGDKKSGYVAFVDATSGKVVKAK